MCPQGASKFEFFEKILFHSQRTNIQWIWIAASVLMTMSMSLNFSRLCVYTVCYNHALHSIICCIMLYVVSDDSFICCVAANGRFSESHFLLYYSQDSSFCHSPILCFQNCFSVFLFCLSFIFILYEKKEKRISHIQFLFCLWRKLCKYRN